MTVVRLLAATTLLAGLAALPTSVAAQVVAVKAGVTFASFLQDEWPAANRRGVVAGISVRVPAGERFSLQFEGLFSEKGAAFEYGDDRIRYLEGPALGRLDVADPDAATRPFLMAGIAPAFRLNARATRTGPGGGTFRLDTIEPFDVGWVAGGGLEIGRMVVEARYTRGLRSVIKPGRHEPLLRHNRVFGLMAGYVFR